MDEKLEEHRRFPRIRLQVALSYQVRGKPEFFNGAVNNISVGGLCFRSFNFMPRDTLMNLRVEVLSHVINPMARIAWVNSLGRSDSYQLGVEFIEMNLDEKKYLQDYVEMKNQ